MLLWLVAALCFVICVVACRFDRRITWQEATGLFIASVIAFAAQLNYIYRKNTTDYQMVSGVVTSKIYRPAYTFRDSHNNEVHMPEVFLLEQAPHDMARYLSMKRPYEVPDGGHMEVCWGECLEPVLNRNMEGKAVVAKTGVDGRPIFLIEVSPQKFARTNPGNPSVVWQKYFNPVKASDEAVFAKGTEKIPNFAIYDYNTASRLIGSNDTGPNVVRSQSLAMEQLNASLASRSNISVGIIFRPDEMFFEKLKRAWHHGKANEFTVVIFSPDGKRIVGVDVLAWDNFGLVESVRQALVGVSEVDVDKVVQTVGTVLIKGPVFQPKDFKKLGFLNVQIPSSDYLFVLSYQLILMIYLVMLLSIDPSTKAEKANWMDISETWRKGGRPRSPRYYLHPFSSTGLLCFYTMIPWVFFQLWEGFFG